MRASRKKTGSKSLVGVVEDAEMLRAHLLLILGGVCVCVVSTTIFVFEVCECGRAPDETMMTTTVA